MNADSEYRNSLYQKSDFSIGNIWKTSQKVSKSDCWDQNSWDCVVRPVFFFSIFLQHFVALEKLEKALLKLTWLATRLVQLRARNQLTILVIRIYQTNVLYLKSYQSLFLVSVFIRFCSAWKALSNHMKTSPMAYPIHSRKELITVLLRL